VVAGLNAVYPYDWAEFLTNHIKDVHPDYPLQGLARGGYELVYTDKPTDYFKDYEAGRKMVDLTYSIGVTLNHEGGITSVLWEGPAYKAGLTVGDKLMAVNGIAYDSDRLKEAITAAKGGTAPVSLIVKDGDHFRTVAVDYHGGLRYPRLQRIAGKPDLLSRIYEPLK
jgi:predicted metalloprotease with PDZ domain